MAMEYEAPEDLSNEGGFLKEPGVYHVAVIDANEDSVYRGGDKKGQLRGGFDLQVEILAGPHAKQTAEVFGRNPNLSHKDQGAFCRKVQGRILEAIGVLNPADRGRKVTVELHRDENGEKKVVVLGRQCIVKFTKNENGFIELDGANIWHIDDPTAEKCERNQKALELIPKSLRRDPKSFAKPESNAAGKSNAASGNGAAKSPPTPPAGQPSQQPVGAAASAGVDIDDI